MNAHNKSTGEEIAEELLTPGYVERALHRATRRKSRWNLVLLSAAIVSIGVVSILLVQIADLYLQSRGSRPLFSPDTAERTRILAVCGALFVSLPLGMVLANLLVWLIPPARRALNEEAKAHPGTDYWTAQRHLTWIATKLVALYEKLLGKL